MEQIFDTFQSAPFLLSFILGAALVLTLSIKRRRTIRGRARVIDGDSLIVDGHQIRIAGIDAPEIGQILLANGRSVDIGKMARAHMARLIGKGDVSCRVLGQDRYGRKLAVCYNRDGMDLGGAMVRDGMARAYGYRSRGQARKYRFRQTWARMSGRGLWAKGSAWSPAEWRRAN